MQSWLSFCCAWTLNVLVFEWLRTDAFNKKWPTTMAFHGKRWLSANLQALNHNNGSFDALCLWESKKLLWQLLNLGNRVGCNHRWAILFNLHLIYLEQQTWALHHLYQGPRTGCLGFQISSSLTKLFPSSTEASIYLFLIDRYTFLHTSGQNTLMWDLILSLGVFQYLSTLL